MRIRIKEIFLTVYFVLYGTVNVSAQKSAEIKDFYSAENRYSLLLSQVNIYRDLQLLTNEQKQMMGEADEYASRSEYEMAIIYLEEALALPASATAIPIDYPGQKTENPFSVSIISGLDFNRQEFEIGYLENDSTVLEEINKPYGGVRANYIKPTGLLSQLELLNEFRYDQDNIRDNYKLGWRYGETFLVFYNGYWNESKELSSNTFWEHELDTRIGAGYASRVHWSVQNSFTLKDYKNTTAYIGDYYRNRFAAYIEWPLSGLHLMNAEVQHELNETTGTDDNDYAQAVFRTGYRYDRENLLNFTLKPEFILRDYQLGYEDSTISNRYIQFGADLLLEIPLYKYLRVEIEDNFYLKRFREKSELEPDYRWNIFRSSLMIDLTQSFETGIGYEWEAKNHNSDPNSVYDATEQNYYAHGISVILNYFSLGGTYFSATASYQWRRYPESLTNDLFSIYSDRNIFSIVLMSFLPLTDNLSINQFVTYDSDTDKDLDQQNNQSIIFTAELEYKF